MTETTETHPATGFDVEGWIRDAHMPEESTGVYQRADVIGELSALRRQIEIEREATAGDERAAGETSELSTLEDRYAALVDTFTGSQLTIYCKALSPDQKRDIRAASDAATEGRDPAVQNADFGWRLLAATITAVRPFDAARVEVAWSPDQVRAMENAIGATQMKQVLAAHQNAQNRLPAVDADFLHRPSGEVDGQG